MKDRVVSSVFDCCKGSMLSIYVHNEWRALALVSEVTVNHVSVQFQNDVSIAPAYRS
jgi:hypothetical protein